MDRKFRKPVFEHLPCSFDEPGSRTIAAIAASGMTLPRTIAAIAASGMTLQGCAGSRFSMSPGTVARCADFSTIAGVYGTAFGRTASGLTGVGMRT
jgi:hypothetical protein